MKLIEAEIIIFLIMNISLLTGIIVSINYLLWLKNKGA